MLNFLRRSKKEMTKIIEEYYCDICGKKMDFKQKGKVDVHNGEDYPHYRYEQNKEVCAECSNLVLDFIKSMKKGDR